MKQVKEYNKLLMLIILACIILNVNTSCVLKIEASSTGLEDGNYFRIEINDVSYTNHAQGRGFNFFEIDAISGQIYETKNFDTHLNTAQTDSMVNYINLLEPGIIIVVGVVDEASRSMTSSGYNALYSLGMTQGLQLGYRDGYVLIGGKDLKSTGQAVNQHKPKLSGEAYVSKCIRDSISTDCSNYIHVVSGGMQDYERFAYYVNHQYKPLPSNIQYERGLFIVVFDKDDASIVKDVKRYDTYVVQTDETNLVTFLNNITIGDHVLIGAMDSVETHLSSNFYSSIQSIGGPSGLSIGHRESFAIIGRKGDSVGTAAWKKNSIGNGGVLIGKCLQGCSFQCATCSGHKDNCDSCSRSTGINSKPNCNCAIKFYEQSQSQCSACLNKCAECINNSQCTVCTGVGRQSSIPNCSCLPGYYETGVNQTDCGKCDYPCGNCFGTSTSCTDCSTLDNRKDTSTCLCQDYYYDDNTECLNCVYPCKKCSSSSQCITCQTTDHRVSITDCRCQPNFFDNGSSCEQCDYPCYNCTGAANQCDSCVVDDNRSNSHPCSCNSGYFDNGSNCQKCHYKCSECTDFDTCKPNQCSDSTRDPLSNCICKEGFFDEGESLCSQCSYKCKACSGNADNCDECATGLGRTLALKPDCDCLPTYFDNGNDQADCVACIHPCINCQSLTICDSCVERDFSNDIDTCTCLAGYYELQNLECQICQHQCQTCVNSSDNCLVCIEGDNRYEQPNCKCKDRFYEDSNKICQPCVYPCLKCTQANVCIDCKTTSNRNLPPLDNSTCECSDGYYDTGSLCDKCAMQCETCIETSTNCVNCSEQTRHGGLCICKDGYYDVGVPQCNQCDYKCGTCLDNKDNCIICSDSNRDINNNCLCKEGFYEDGKDLICKPCQYPCVNCISLYNCTKCVQFINEQPESRKSIPSCLCQKGYYKNLQNQECQKCHSRCSQCENDPENCLECNDQYKRQSVDQKCLCKEERFYPFLENNIEICKSCQDNCKKCIDYNTCTLCENEKALPPECQIIVEQNRGFLSFSVNIEGQNVIVTKVCEAQCSECENDVSNCKVCNPGINRTMILPDCGCNQGFYAVKNHTDCQQCHKYCQQCTSYDQCQVCKQDTDRIVDVMTGYCVCRQGFKDVKGICVKCFNYRDQYVQFCPQNTIQDQNLNICIDKTIKYQSNNSIILLCALCVIVITIFAKFIFVKILNRTFKNLKSQQTFKKVDEQSSQNNNTSSLQNIEKNENIL